MTSLSPNLTLSSQFPQSLILPAPVPQSLCHLFSLFLYLSFLHHFRSHYDHGENFQSLFCQSLRFSVSSFHLMNTQETHNFTDFQQGAFSMPTHRVLSATHEGWCHCNFLFSNFMQSPRPVVSVSQIHFLSQCSPTSCMPL